MNANAIMTVAALATITSGLAAQEPTRLMVRAVAHDAKLVGSGVGGAHIVVRNLETGAVLDSGVQMGSTGDTRTIMVDPVERGEAIYDTEGAAGFLAELNIEQPTRILIEARGPLGTAHAAQLASKSLLMLPGEDVLGNGVVLELHGFTVELLEPAGNEVTAGATLNVRARVTMLCGCPTEPGGLWDAEQKKIRARIVQDGAVLAVTELEFSGTTSEYTGTLTPVGNGRAELQVIASEPGRANFGMASKRVMLR